ncbi:MAG: ferredoxin [Candidatus Aenigmatarchaeota archaeon]
MATPKVDVDACIGCGACVSVCPDVFEMRDDGKSHVKNTDDCEGDELKQAVDICPVDAIKLE